MISSCQSSPKQSIEWLSQGGHALHIACIFSVLRLQTEGVCGTNYQSSPLYVGRRHTLHPFCSTWYISATFHDLQTVLLRSISCLVNNVIIQPSMVGYFGICLFLLTSQRNASNDPLAAALFTIDLIRLNFSMRQSIFLKKLIFWLKVQHFHFGFRTYESHNSKPSI